MEYAAVSLSVCATLMLLHADIKIIIPLSLSFVSALCGRYLYYYIEKLVIKPTRLKIYELRLMSSLLCALAAVTLVVLTIAVSKAFYAISPFPKIFPLFYAVAAFACGMTNINGICRAAKLVLLLGTASVIVMLIVKLARGIPLGIVMLNADAYSINISYALPVATTLFAAFISTAATKKRGVGESMRLLLGVAGGGALWILFRIARADAVFMMASVMLCGGILIGQMIAIRRGG